MKKICLLHIVFILTWFALIGSTHATMVDSVSADVVSGQDQPYAQASTESPSLDIGDELIWDAFGDSGLTQQDANVNFFLKSASSESPHSDSKISLWLFLLVAAVFGIVSEILHRLTNTR